MKRMAVEDLASNLQALIKTTPKEQVLLTRRGRPFAFVSNASKYDWEDIGYMVDPEFWKMIRERRKDKGRGVPLEDVMARLARREKAEKSAGQQRRPTSQARPKRKQTAA